MSQPPLVLVVEDEYLLMADLVQVLNNAGFATEATWSAEEALALFVGDIKKYKALITDVRLSGTMNGWEAARCFREKEPALPIIYLTASSVGEWVSEGVPDSILIAKPFAREQLISAVSNLLKSERD